MNVTLPEPSPVHRAALSLHTLCDADRAWVLQSLPASHQQALRPLLEELQALGIPRDARVFDGIVQRPPSGTAPETEFAERDSERIIALLRAEPSRVTAALLASGDLPWLAPRVIGTPLQGAGCSALPATNAPALQAAVRAETKRLLDAQGPQRAPDSFWQRLRDALRSREWLP